MTKTKPHEPTEVDTDRKVALNLRDIPAGLRNRFKAFCGQHELTMTAAVEILMEDVVNGGKARDLLQFQKN